MNKKLLFLLVLLLTATTGAWAQTQWTSGSCTVTLNNGTLTVSGNGAMADYTDPSNRPWHDNMGDITSVVVESGVTSVGMAAFFYCTAMTSVTLPEGLTAIGDMAFFSCSLTSVTIPSTVTAIGTGAFRGCSAMTSVTLPEGLTAIGLNAFNSCSSLTSITIPSTVTSIGQGAFGSCSAVSDVNLYANPDNLTWSVDTHIGSDDFKEGKATKCHVLAEHLSTYQNNFSSVRVTFVGDLKPLTPPTYSVTLAEGTEDAENWSVPKEAAEGSPVTATYSGEKKVKSVKAVKKASAYTQLSAATAEDIGKVVCAAGHLHDAKTAVPDGCTAVGILGKVTETGHGLILALQDAEQQNWNTINGWDNANYASTTLKVLPFASDRGSLASYTTLGETTVSNWAVAQKSDYDAIFTNLGSTTGNDNGKTYDGNVNAYITTGVGGTAIDGRYWSATDNGGNYAWYFRSNKWSSDNKGESYNVRPVLGF